MKLIQSTLIATAIAATSAVPASAHVGPHEASFFTSALHWLTSPTHALFAIVGVVVVGALVLKLKRNRS